MRAKKTILILFIFLGTLSSYGQCNFLKERKQEKLKDELDIDIKGITDYEKLHYNLAAYSAGNFFIDDQGTYFFLLTFYREWLAPYEIRKGQKFIIYFENGIDITLSTYMNFQKIGTRTIRPCFEISREQIELFANSPIDRYRLYFTYLEPTTEEDTHFNVNVNEGKFASALLQPARCVLANWE